MRYLVALGLLGGVVGCQTAGLTQSVPPSATPVKVITMPDGTLAALQPSSNDRGAVPQPVTAPSPPSAAAQASRPTPAATFAGSVTAMGTTPTPSGEVLTAQQTLAEMEALEARRQQQTEAVQQAQRTLGATMQNLDVKLRDIKAQIQDLKSRMDSQDAAADEH